MSAKFENARKRSLARRRRMAKRLARYSVAAGAGIFGVANADAAIVYTNLADQVVDASNTFSIDIDGDATNDFSFTYFNQATKRASIISGSTVNNNVWTYGQAPGGGRGQTPNLVAGMQIDATSPAFTGAWDTGFVSPTFDVAGADSWGGKNNTYLHLVTGGDGSIGSGTDQSGANAGGNWVKPGPEPDSGTSAISWMADTAGTTNGLGYLGVTFRIGGNQHFGWIGGQAFGAADGVSGAAFPLNDDALFVVYDWAYDDVPNTAILAGAGAIASPGPGPGAPPVPEPGTVGLLGLGMLALGGAGMSALRRRRREANEAG